MKPITASARRRWIDVVCVLVAAFVVFVMRVSPLAVTRQQGQKPVFRAGAHFVSVDAYPTRDGQVIEGLTKDDFDVYEDDKPQKIETFEYISAQARPPDDERSTMLTPREGLELAADPHYRVFVIVIDRMSMVKSTWEPLRKALHEFLDTEVEPRDLIGMITTDALWQDLVIGKRLSAIEEELDQDDWLRTTPSEERLVLEGCDLSGMQSRARWDATYTLLESLVRVLGQVREDHSSIVFVSNNMMRDPDLRSYTPQQSISLPKTTLANGRITRVNGDALHEQYCKSEGSRLADINFDRRFNDLTTSARAANVSFYPVRMPALEPNYMREAFPVDMGRQRQPPSEMDIHVRPPDNLPELAKKTDGFPIAMADGLAKGFHRIAADIGAHYLLGYYTNNENWDGRIRRITVRMKPKGTPIAARREYRAPTMAEIAALSASRDVRPTVRSPEVAAALGALTHIRPSAQFFAYGAVSGRTMTVAVEVPPEAVDAGRWSEGGTLELIADTADGEMVGTASGKLLGNGRALVTVPLEGTASPSNLFVRLHADGEAITERVALNKQVGSLVGDPVLYRSGPRGTGVPVASFLFTRLERVRLDWPVSRDVDKYDARLLDQFGQPLQTRPQLQAQEASPVKHLVSEISFAPLGRGDYIIELTVAAGEKIEQKLTAFRVK